jgi:hypothetical protein
LNLGGGNGQGSAQGQESKGQSHGNPDRDSNALGDSRASAASATPDEPTGEAAMLGKLEYNGL